MPSRRRAGHPRTASERLALWDAKMDGDIYARTLQKLKPLAREGEATYQAEFDRLLAIVKRVLEGSTEFYNAQAYMWYAEKLWSLTQRFSGPALQKEADALYLWHLARGRDDIALRAIAKALGVNISPLETIIENVMAPLLLSILAQGTITADGTEQTVVEYTGKISQISGYIDLSNMEDGDAVTVKLYVKIKPDGGYKLYHAETFNDKQEEPALYILPKVTGIAYKVTIQQTKGTYKSFDYLFIKGA
jgi:hypothetical protein